MKYLFTAILFLFLQFSTLHVYAQPPGLPEPPDQSPIDGGLGVLAALGGAYAVKKLRDKKRQ